MFHYLRCCQGISLLLLCCPAFGVAAADEPFEIKIIDAENGWPVPLVELTTTHQVRFVSDNAGIIAFDLPELMGVETWLSVQGHGYSVPPDGFGYRGIRVTPTPGGSTTIEIQRQLPAQRLGRITGGGLFGESQRFGRFETWRESGRLGCDSVQLAKHNGKLYWGWGDTTLPGYPLGRFHMTGATTELQPVSEWQPPIQLQYQLFRAEDGRPRNVAELSGAGPTWLGAYASLRDAQGQSHLVATYSKIKPPLTAYETGLCIWDEKDEVFRRHKIIWSLEEQGSAKPLVPRGHLNQWQDPHGKSWLLFGDPFPTFRCPDSFEAWQDPAQWEAIQAPTAITTEDGKEIRPHRGSIAFNEYLNRWVCIFCQFQGESSSLGELWYCDAASPFGPWENGTHVVTHQKYSFYNPLLHPELVAADSPFLLFEATYTKTFSKTSSPTPRHDYNQILYRLDLEQFHSDVIRK